jgi:outer membrane lipoprotein-sorting protein
MKLVRTLLLVVLVGLVGCKKALPPTPTIPKLSAEQILSKLKARQGSLTAFSAWGRLTLISPKQNATGKALIKGKLPETLRVDLKDPLGRAVLKFATNGRTVEILFPRENKLLKGPATPANLAAFIPPGVTVPQALRLLVGDLPLSQGPPARLRLDPGERMYVLEWLKSDDSLQERLWVAADELLPRKEEWFRADGRLAFSAELEDFSQGSPAWPQQLKLVTPSPREELRLTYKDFTPNPSLSPGDLVVPRPPGVAVLPLKP